jgi:ornithine cyclodeaminase
MLRPYFKKPIMKIILLEQIKRVLPSLDLTPAIEAGFAAYSAGRAVVPPVGELLLDHGDVHIKYGYIKDHETYVIKIASGFYDNPQIGLPTGNGLMLLFDQRTGQPVCILLDEGYLTNIRTAIAGAICAKYLAPENVERIGILGTGTQARLQLEYLKGVTDCREALIWAYDQGELPAYRRDMQAQGFRIETTLNARDLLQHCNLIVTTTPATAPLLVAADLRAGIHITAMGSDTPNKQELDGTILGRADLVVADSLAQCLARGEIHQAIKGGHLHPEGVVELGQIIAGEESGRTSNDQITIADLTGVAVQDIQIATAVFAALSV